MVKAQVVECIVLSQTNYGEADRLITLFTKQYGKLRTIGKGVRRIHSRRGGNLDLLNQVRVRIVFGKSMPIITEADVILSFASIKENLSTTVYAYYILEIVNDLTAEEQVHIDIYFLLCETLQLLAKQPKRILIHAFEIKFLQSLGFWDDSLLPKDDQKLLALTAKIRVQSLQQIVQNQADDETVLALGKITRRRLEDVAEKEFASPKVRVKLQEYLRTIDH